MWIRLQQCVGTEAQQCKKFGSHLNTLVDAHALKQIQGPKQRGEVGKPPPSAPDWWWRVCGGSGGGADSDWTLPFCMASCRRSCLAWSLEVRELLVRNSFTFWRKRNRPCSTNYKSKGWVFTFVKWKNTIKKKADGYVAHLLTNIAHLFYKAFPLLPQTFVFFNALPRLSGQEYQFN